MGTGSESARLRVAGSRLTLAVLGGAAAALLAAALAAPPAGAAAARMQAAPTAAPGEAQRIARHWTPQRRRSARPLLPPGAAPEPAEALARASFAPVAEPGVPPFIVNGRLFVQRERKRGYCSATAIDSPSRRLVLTAAHCLNSGPQGKRGRSSWSRYVEFVPSYSGGAAPFGAFVARRNQVFAPRQWVKFGNPNFDIGAILTEPNAEGVAVADAVGGATVLLDATRRQAFQTFGYPRRSSWMQGCESSYEGDDPLTYRVPGPPTLAIGCRWAPGASGGGWLVEGGTVINGLTSYGKQGDRRHTFGPYFSSDNVGHLIAGF